MLNQVLKQTSWSMIGTIFGFSVGFFVKMYLVNAVGTDAFGKYVIGQTVVSTVQIFIAFAIPQIMLKFLPAFLERKEFDKANNLASFSIKFLFVIGVVAGIIMMIFSSQISDIFKSGDTQLQYIILVSAIYVPLTLYSLAINSAYRSLLKIKEIVIYGTIWLITFRAILTFIVFTYSTDIVHFIYIELVSLTLVMFIMTFKFDFKKLNFLKPFSFSEVKESKDITKFTKKMYFYALIGFFGGYSLNIIMGIKLTTNDVGVYAILVTIAGLCTFLLTSLNTVFAPIISKLHASNDLHKLESLFKDTTFIINIITAPFIAIMILFSHDILGLYGENVSSYVQAFSILVLGYYIGLFVGNSGMLLLMGGRENNELYIKIFNIVFVISASLFFMEKYGLIGAVIISTSSMIIVNLLQVYYVKKKFGFTPWTISSLVILLMLCSIIFYFILKNPYFDYSLFDYFWISIVTLLVFWLPFIFKVKEIIKNIKENRG